MATARVIDGKSIKVLQRTAERLLGGHAVRHYRHHQQRRRHHIKNSNENDNINDVGDLKDSSSSSATIRSDGSDGSDGDVENSDSDPDSNENSNFSIIREGLCFRPVTAKGTPLIAKMDNRALGLGEGKGVGEEKKSEGVWVAAGHGPWGISLSLGTGMVVAEMVEGKERLSAEVAGLGF